MLPALLLLIIFSVPLTAILASTYLKARRLELERGGDAGLANRVAALEAENRQLSARLEVLETIITMDDHPGSRRVRVDARGEDGTSSARVSEGVGVERGAHEERAKAGR